MAEITEAALTLPTSDGDMAAYAAAPKGAAPAPGVVVLQEAFGVNHHIQDVCRRLAYAGFSAVAPELFHRTGQGVDVAYTDFNAARVHMAKLTNEGLERDVNAALAHLRQGGGPAPAVIGFCLGGFGAFLAACRCEIRTAVSFYGGGIVRARAGIGLEPLVGEADRRAAPLLCVYGAADQGIPPADVEAVRAALLQRAVRSETVVYAEAGHGFCCDEREAYRPGPAAAAWDRALGWLRRDLA